VEKLNSSAVFERPPSVIAIGASTGGPAAIVRFFEQLGHGIRQPVFITQHMPAHFTALLAESLTRHTGLPCREALDGEEVRDGRIYIAPGDYHMTVTRSGGRIVIRLKQTPPEHFCRPAVDPMLSSLSEVYHAGVLAVILTGMGCDGLAGCRKIYAAGGQVMAQDEASNVVWGMPGAVAAAGICRHVGTIDSIARRVRGSVMSESGSDDFRFIAGYLKERSGLHLSAGKEYLVEARLAPVARKFGLSGIPALAAALRQTPGADMELAVVDAMTTNETYFFRDTAVFAFLRERMKMATGRIRLWSAACSSGQEAYSLAMIAAEEGLVTDIVASDMSSQAVAAARGAVYSQFEIQRGLPARLMLKYFTKGEGDKWRLSPDVAARVSWRSHNLLHDAPPAGVFDVILCRNVLMYFSAADRCRVVARLYPALRPGGFLVLGAAELPLAVTGLVPCGSVSGVYQKSAEV
jgi:chemotaxis methyl-accepting protein methylase